MSNSWFRWYHGSCEDGKFRMVARHANVTLRDVISVWAMILEGASQSKNRGELKFEEDYIASVLGFTDDEIDRIFMAMVEAKLINVAPVGGYVTNWNKRQVFKEDNSAIERKRRQRERDNCVTSETVTPCHANVTPPDTDKKERKKPTTLVKKIPISEVSIEVISEWAEKNLKAKIDLSRELLKFKNHEWKNKIPSDGVKAFKNWLLKAEDWAKPPDDLIKKSIAFTEGFD